MNRQWKVAGALFSALAALALIIASCSPGASPAPAANATATPAAAASNTTTSTITSQEVITGVVEKSGSAQATAKNGIVVTSTEEVSTPRTHIGGEYKDVSSADAVSFHPYLTTDSGSSAYQAQVWAGALLRLDENTLDYIPNMAQSYEISKDGLTFTFHLRHGMQWSDGRYGAHQRAFK